MFPEIRVYHGMLSLQTSRYSIRSSASLNFCKQSCIDAALKVQSGGVLKQMNVQLQGMLF